MAAEVVLVERSDGLCSRVKLGELVRHKRTGEAVYAVEQRVEGIDAIDA